MKALIRLLQAIEKKNLSDTQIDQVTNAIMADADVPALKGRKLFTIPTIQDIVDHIKADKPQELHLNAEKIANEFWNFYNSKNWKVGSAKMSNWQSALARWDLSRWAVPVYKPQEGPTNKLPDFAVNKV